ncbi:MAG TPA: methyltransferase, partial [Flavobacteriaceae bacterium]|nr:methyltransferase [Flavobacteriaceae bacterium]
MKEKERYLSHQNDVEDSGFQKFVSPIVRAIKANHSPKDKGLDFGAGTGPVVSKLLEDLNYKMALYDPFFHPSKAPLLNTY